VPERMLDKDLNMEKIIKTYPDKYSVTVNPIKE
jgi:hypothetical protein